MFKAIARLFKLMTQIDSNLDEKIEKIIVAVGGLDNILENGACATRLRLTLKTVAVVDKEALKADGAYGMICLDAQRIQIIYGPKANMLSQLLEERLLKSHM